jgi:hypothetical protein
MLQKLFAYLIRKQRDQRAKRGLSFGKIMFQLGDLLADLSQLIASPFIVIARLVVGSFEVVALLSSMAMSVAVFVSSQVWFLRGNVLFLPTTAATRVAVDDRRTFVAQALTNGDAVRLRQIPPGLNGWQPKAQPLTRLESVAQRIKLNHAKDDEELLFGRVSDALSAISESSSVRQSVGGLEYNLSLRKLAWWQRRSGRYDWVVRIATRDRSLLENYLLPMQGWLGIGIQFTDYKHGKLQTACDAASGRNATIAGSIGRVHSLLCLNASTASAVTSPAKHSGA